MSVATRLREMLFVEEVVSKPEPPAVQEKIADLALVEQLCEMWRQSRYLPARGHFGGEQRCLVGMMVGDGVYSLPAFAYRQAAGAMLGRSEAFGTGLERGWELGHLLPIGKVAMSDVGLDPREAADFKRGYTVGAEVARRVLG